MTTETLSDWEMLAIATVVRMAADKGTLHVEHGKALADKLERATHIRVTYTNILVALAGRMDRDAEAGT